VDSATTRRIGRWTSCSTPCPRSRVFDAVKGDTTSTYREVDVSDELAELEPKPESDDGVSKAVEGGQRRFGKFKDHRDDLPQVVIAMVVTTMESRRALDLSRQ
jgi:hypothetical protein